MFLCLPEAGPNRNAARYSESAALSDPAANVGALGFDMFSKVDFKLDFRNKKLNLYSQEHCPGAVVSWADNYASTRLRRPCPPVDRLQPSRRTQRGGGRRAKGSQRQTCERALRVRARPALRSGATDFA